MKRVNLNLIAKREDVSPSVLYFELLGEEETEDSFRRQLLLYLKNGAFEADAFSSWVKTSFSHVGEEAKIERLEYPLIYYDHAGFRAFFTFLFDANHAEAIVWRWENRIFRGSTSELEKWLARTRQG